MRAARELPSAGRKETQVSSNVTPSKTAYASHVLYAIAEWRHLSVVCCSMAEDQAIYIITLPRAKNKEALLHSKPMLIFCHRKDLKLVSLCS